MQIIVSDSGPIIHLSEVKSLYLITNMGNIYVPKSVYLEVSNYKIILSNSFQIQYFDEKENEEIQKIIINGRIHIGEAESIVLAKKIKADYLLTDDASARLYSEISKINVHGSLGIVLWNLVHNYIDKDEANKLLFSLKNSSLWLTDKVFQRALSILDRL